jgi:CRISPR-associated protein Csx17
MLLSLSVVQDMILLSNNELRSGPIPRFRPEWVSVADDNSSEWRLAVSFALSGFRWVGEKHFDSIHRHLVAKKNEETAAVMKGRRGLDDAIALISRRLIEAGQKGIRNLPLEPSNMASTSIFDISELLSGRVDLDRTLALARALMTVDLYKWKKHPQRLISPKITTWPDDAWIAIRLAMLPWPLPDGRNIRVDPAVFRRLVSGDASTAFQLALRRLNAVGIRTSVQICTVSQQTAKLWAASLAFPINKKTAENLLHRLDPAFMIQK